MDHKLGQLTADATLRVYSDDGKQIEISLNFSHLCPVYLVGFQDKNDLLKNETTK